MKEYDGKLLKAATDLDRTVQILDAVIGNLRRAGSDEGSGVIVAQGRLEAILQALNLELFKEEVEEEETP